MVISSRHTLTGPFSAVRSPELAASGKDSVQDPTQAATREPLDEVVNSAQSGSPVKESEPGFSTTESLATQGMTAAGQALAAFPQVVHILADPKLHLGQCLAKATGLPVISLTQTKFELLPEVLSGATYARGFILEGFPESAGQAQALDALLDATDPAEHRVLGWEVTGPKQQEVMDHYVNSGTLWMVDVASSHSSGRATETSLLECLAGLPAVSGSANA